MIWEVVKKVQIYLDWGQQNTGKLSLEAGHELAALTRALTPPPSPPHSQEHTLLTELAVLF